MDDVPANLSSACRQKISLEEMERRRKLVRMADAENRLEGIKRRPESDAAFDAFVCGEIEAPEIIARLSALPSPT